MKAQDRMAGIIRTVVSAAVAALAISLAAGCSSSKPRPTPSGAASGSARTGYSVTYSATDTSGGDLGLSFDTIRVLTDGGLKVRFTAGKPGGPYAVTDGVHAMVPNENGDGYQVAKPSDIGRFVLHDSDGTLSAWCANAKESAPTSVLNRATRHYICTPVNLDADPGFFVADEISVDKESGVVLHWSQGLLQVTATEIDPHAALPTDAFVMPAAPASSPKGPSIPTFQIPLVGGGSLTDTTYQGAPVVFVAGSAKDIRALTVRLAHLTGGGKAPRVVGLWLYDDFKGLEGSLTNPADVAAWAKQISATAGKFDVPVGIDFKGNVAGQMTGAFFPDNPQAVAILVDSNGMQVKIVPATAGDAEFASAIKGLH
jgi:hypothetical protein